jgi:ketosteroid isomerase-like protein
MPEATPTSRLAIAQDFVKHLGRGDSAPALALLSPKATYRVSGDHALAGSFAGPEEITRHLSKLFERTSGTLDSLKWEDWMVGEYHIAVLSDIAMSDGARRFAGRALFLMRFDRDDKIDEVVVLSEDPRSLERFIGQQPT